MKTITDHLLWLYEQMQPQSGGPLKKYIEANLDVIKGEKK